MALQDTRTETGGGGTSIDLSLIDFGGIFGEKAPKSERLRAAEAQARRNLNLPRGLDELRRNPAFQAERDRLLLGFGNVAPNPTKFISPTTQIRGFPDNISAQVRSDLVGTVPAGVRAIQALGTIFAGLGNVIGGILFPQEMGRDEDIPVRRQERTVPTDVGDLSRGPVQEGLGRDVPGGSSRTITKEEAGQRREQIARERNRQILIEQNRRAMERNAAVGPQRGAPLPTDIPGGGIDPNTGRPFDPKTVGRIPGRPWPGTSQTPQQAQRAELLKQLGVLGGTVALSRIFRPNVSRPRAAPFFIGDFPSAAVPPPPPAQRQPLVPGLGQAPTFQSRMDFAPRTGAPQAQPMSQAKPKAGQSKCEIVKRRRRRKGQCREGFFKEMPNGTKYTTWRVSDCATGRTIASKKSAKASVQKIINQVRN